MVEHRPIHLLRTCIRPHMWVVLQITFQEFPEKYQWRNPFLSKTTDYWAAIKTDFWNERFPGNFPNFGEQLFCETSECCCFLRSQDFKAPITKHPSLRIPLLVNLFLPNTHNRELGAYCFVKREGGYSFSFWYCIWFKVLFS